MTMSQPPWRGSSGACYKHMTCNQGITVHETVCTQLTFIKYAEMTAWFDVQQLPVVQK